MLRIARMLLWVAGLTFVTNGYAGDLNESAVRGVIQRVDTAVNSLDARALGRVLSDDVSITMNISMQGRKQVARPTKAEYLAMLEQGWGMYENYRYSRSNMEISVRGDRALVTANVRESMTIQGNTIAGNSREEVTIELVNGVPLVTEVVGYTEM